MATGGRDQSITGGHEIFFEWRCNKCEESDLMVEAEAFCSNCNESYCGACLKDHNRFVKGHKVLGALAKDDWGKSTHSPSQNETGEYCSEHDGQGITLYCKHHDEVCCSVCAVLHHGETCRPTMSYIPKVAQGVIGSTEFKDFIAMNDRLLKTITTIEQERTEYISALNTSRASCRSCIESIWQRLSQRLEEMKESSISDMNDKHDQEEAAAQLDIDSCKERKQDIENIQREIDAGDSKRESSVFAIMKLKQKTHKTCQSLCDTLGGKQMKTLAFRENPDLQRCLPDSLGECTASIENNDGDQDRDNVLEMTNEPIPSKANICSETTEEIDIDQKWANDAGNWCKELTDPERNIWCTFDNDRSKIIVCCGSYKNFEQVKHSLNCKQGKVKATGRRRRLLDSESTLNTQQSPVEVISDDGAGTKVNDFQWNRDAKDLRCFKTNEGIQLYIHKADILHLPVDCIVNAANDMLQHGGGIAKAIEDAAGPSLTRESDDMIRKKGKVPVGMCCSTTAGRLPYRRVIHAVGPRWSDYQPHFYYDVKKCATDLYMAIMTSLLKAEEEGMSSVALPALSSAIFGVPEDICTYSYAKAVVDYSRRSSKGKIPLKEIHFVDINAKMVQKIQDRFAEFIIQGKTHALDINKFVKFPSYGSFRNAGVRGKTTSHMQPVTQTHGNTVIVEEKGAGKQCFYIGENNELFIYSTNIFNVQSDALVCVVDNYGNAASRIALDVEKKFIGPWKDDYTLKKSPSYGTFHADGHVIQTEGYGHIYKHILHVVLPRNMDSLPVITKKEILRNGYLNLLKLCQDEREIKSIAVSHLGTDPALSTERFFETYVEFCQRRQRGAKKMTIHFVCYERDKSDMVYKKFHSHAANKSKE